jgi:hypothetical protein
MRKGTSRGGAWLPRWYLARIRRRSSHVYKRTIFLAGVRDESSVFRVHWILTFTMKASSIFLCALSLTTSLVKAHATVQAVWINGVDQGQGDNRNGYIRFPPNNSPVVAITSQDMTCNKNSGPVTRTLQVKTGDQVLPSLHTKPQDRYSYLIVRIRMAPPKPHTGRPNHRPLA